MQLQNLFYRIISLKKVSENWFKIYTQSLIYRNFYLDDFDKNFIIPRLKLSTYIDLKLTEEDILSNFKTNYRNEIKKCNSYSFFLEINKSNISEIKKEYDLFANTKNITRLNESRLLLNECIIGTNKFDIDSKCCNVYLKNNNNVVLLYSYTIGNYSKISSSAQKKLHYEAILFFKKNGLDRYDFGGISLKPKLKGINKFKLGFGGLRSSYFYGISLKSKYSRIIRNLLIDLKHPKRFIRGTIKSVDINRTDTANSDYELLLLIFKHIDFENYQTFYDIGCGKGAVYSLFKYLNLLQSINYIGIEADKSIFKKFLKSKSVHFINSNALEYKYDSNSIFYLFNPFDFKTVEKFMKLIPDKSLLITYNITKIETYNMKIKNELEFNNKKIIIYEVCN